MVKGHRWPLRRLAAWYNLPPAVLAGLLGGYWGFSVICHTLGQVQYDDWALTKIVVRSSK